jgi:hypothetical protein
MKNSKHTIGNRTRDLPACSAVPQPTAPLRTSHTQVNDSNIDCYRIDDSPKMAPRNRKNVRVLGYISFLVVLC